MKTCILCGKQFQPKFNAQKVCNDVHYRKCKCCDNYFIIKRPSSSQQCCSKQCSIKLREQTMFDRYGVTQPFKSKEFLEKREQTNLKKFGYRHAAQNPEIKEKERMIFQERYGVDTPFLMPDFSEKSKRTCIEKYGVEIISQISNMKSSKDKSL